MTHRLLSYDDPRLHIHVADANSDDPLTRAAIKLMDDALASPGDRVIAAPSFGLPVRLISVRQGEWRHHLCNPRFSGARKVRINWGETSPHTGPVRRNVWRADEVDIMGIDLSGQQRQMTLKGDQAIAVQQAFEIFDRPDPFSWVTGFQRNWIRASSPAAAERLAGINRGLLEAARPGTEAAVLAPLAFASMNEIEVRGDSQDRSVLTRIDMNDPGSPVCPQDMEILSILLGSSMLGQLLILSRQRLGLAVAALAMLTNLKVSYRPDGWPVQATNRLGLGGAMQPYSGNLAQIAPRSTPPKFDGIVMDMDDPYLADLSGPNPLSGFGKSLSGASAPLIIAGPARSQSIEDGLLSALPFVYQMDSRDGGVIYVGLKERLSLDAAYGRLLALENASSLAGMLEAMAQGWHLLTKSGERQPL